VGPIDSKPEAAKEGSLAAAFWMSVVQEIPGDLLQRHDRPVSIG